MDHKIIAYFKNRTLQTVVEGTNKKIKLIKVQVYGSIDFNN
ncbi:transposase [cyanobacterium endosymbiont of Rhopalodia gibberula]